MEQLLDGVNAAWVRDSEQVIGCGKEDVLVRGIGKWEHLSPSSFSRGMNSERGREMYSKPEYVWKSKFGLENFLNRISREVWILNEGGTCRANLGICQGDISRAFLGADTLTLITIFERDEFWKRDRDVWTIQGWGKVKLRIGAVSQREDRS